LYLPSNYIILGLALILAFYTLLCCSNEK